MDMTMDKSKSPLSSLNVSQRLGSLGVGTQNRLTKCVGLAHRNKKIPGINLAIATRISG
jgi:hypothetical protein